MSDFRSQMARELVEKVPSLLDGVQDPEQADAVFDVVEEFARRLSPNLLGFVIASAKAEDLILPEDRQLTKHSSGKDYLQSLATASLLAALNQLADNRARAQI